jgi:hypothetical protein
MSEFNCYRANFIKELDVDYWGTNSRKLQAESYLNFNTLHIKYYPLIKSIKNQAKMLGIKYIWHFYEPYIEITWYSTQEQADELYKIIASELLSNNINSEIEKINGLDYADWFCHSPEEREFGGKRHALSGEFVDLIDEYKDSISSGKGINEQVKRTIHTICNPLGINYTDEAKICFSRGLICILFKYFSFNRAVWIYRNIFRQKY